LIDWTLLKRTFPFSHMLMALGRCSGLFSEGVTSWDETGQWCYWRIIPVFLFENFGACWCLYVSTVLLWLMHRDCKIFTVRAWLGVLILRWVWSVLLLTHHTCFSLLRTLVHAGVCMFPQSCDLCTETAGSVCSACLTWCSQCVYTLDLSLSSHPKDVRVTSPK
jgi:hypothetical protein